MLQNGLVQQLESLAPGLCQVDEYAAAVERVAAPMDLHPLGQGVDDPGGGGAGEAQGLGDLSHGMAFAVGEQP